jgi:hypothetical protein
MADVQLQADETIGYYHQYYDTMLLPPVLGGSATAWQVAMCPSSVHYNWYKMA